MERKILRFITLTLLLSFLFSLNIFAAPKTMPGGDVFDAVFYAEKYPDVVYVFGRTERALYGHFLRHGRTEGRLPHAGDTGSVISSNTEAREPIEVHDNIKRGMTTEQYNEAYKVAEALVNKHAHLDLEEQLKAVAKDLFELRIKIPYNHRIKHYNNVYGFFVLKEGISCAGGTRAAILVANIMGLETQHRNEGKWMHQWARVNVNGAWWALDADTGMAMLEIDYISLFSLRIAE